jgi:hypothetical protein
MLHEQEPTGSLNKPTASLAINATASFTAKNDPDSTTDHPGDRPQTVIAGRYQLLELIGEGGMGSVWLAQQSEPVIRFVAIKLTKTGMDTRAVLARFEAERQALAVMEHPSIARILDGGMTEAGTPYFVMEYVKGVKILQAKPEHCLRVACPNFLAHNHHLSETDSTHQPRGTSTELSALASTHRVVRSESAASPEKLAAWHRQSLRCR